MITLLLRAPDPPLTPSGADARSQLRRELLHPEYHQQNVVQQVINWVDRRIQRGLEAAQHAPPLSTAAAMLIGVALVLAVVWLASRARRTAAVAKEERAVLTAEIVTAAELRQRAEAAFDGGRFEEAVVEAFRAVALRQVERGRLSNTPGATAHEVAAELAAEFPTLVDRVTASADLFDAVLYGDRPAVREQAGAVLALDDDLAGARR